MHREPARARQRLRAGVVAAAAGAADDHNGVTIVVAQCAIESAAVVDTRGTALPFDVARDNTGGGGDDAVRTDSYNR